MILFSVRQKQILLTLLNETAGISLKEMEKQLHVSRRTLYREFSNIRLFLEQNNLILTSYNGRYLLEGSDDNKTALKDSLIDQHSVYEMPTAQRQNAVAAYLLLTNETTKILSIASELNVSEGTIQHDLLTLADSLSEYHLVIERKKGVGVQIVGDEIKRRQVLCGILLTEINGYSLLRYLNNHDLTTKNYFMSLLPYDLLFECNRNLTDHVFSQINFYSDRQRISTILMFAITIFRFTYNNEISQLPKFGENLEYLGITYKFFANFQWHPIDDAPQVTQKEAIFLAQQLQNAHLNTHSLAFDTEDFSVMIQVRELVELVSLSYGWDFRRNPYFFKRLSKHIENMIRHEQDLLPNVQIETLQQISSKYSRLFKTIQEKWLEIFPDKKLTTPESQLLLLYFANEYTNRGYQRQLRALIVCENGFSTSQILKSRLTREIPQIQKIDTTKVSDLYKLEQRNYDIILSTIDLPGFPRDYQVVSPLLLENDVNKIRNWLQTYLKKYSVIQEEPLPIENKFSVSPTVLREKESEIHFYNQIVQIFKVAKVENDTRDSLAEITHKIVENVPQDFIIDDQDVINNLLKRVQLAPIGIPDTNLAILHTSTVGVKKPYCAIFELDQAFTMMAMDQEEIPVKRMIVMLAPQHIDKSTSDTLGMISSLIIMNDDHTDLFEHGDTHKLRSFLTEKFLAAIKK